MTSISVTTAYLIYLPIVIGMTYVVARNLFKNGRVFMLDIFHGRESIAFATNRLFEMGFYLINVGFALLILEIYAYNNELALQSAVEILSQKIGGFSIYLGVMLFFNLFMFFRGKRKSRQAKQQAEHLEQVRLRNATILAGNEGEQL